MKSKWNKLIKPKWFGQQSYKIWKIIQLVKCKWRLHRVYKTRLDGEYKIVAWRFCCFYPQYVISTIIICTLTSVLFRPLGASAQHFPLQVSIMPRAALHVFYTHLIVHASKVGMMLETSLGGNPVPFIQSQLPGTPRPAAKRSSRIKIVHTWSADLWPETRMRTTEPAK